LTLGFIAFVFSVWLAATQLVFEAGQEGLVSRDQPFWSQIDRLYEVFPQLEDSAIVVVESRSMDEADDAASKFAARLRAEPELFSSVFFPEEEEFFKRNALLFTDVDELSDIVDKLAKAQPALAAIAQDPNLRGFFDLINVGIEALENGTELPPSFTELMDETALAVTALAAGQDMQLSWSEQMMGVDDARALRRILMVQPPSEGFTTSHERRMIARIRQIASEPEFSEHAGTSVRVTGRLALAYDEIETAKTGVGLAGTMSLLCLAIILMMGLPSFRLIAAILVALFAGLGWSMGFAAIAVGTLNLISATFAVLFVGLGVAHALHVSLRYREYHIKGMAHFDAIRAAAATTGGAVALCAITSAIGFAAFVPTDFLGIAELGLIAAGGMGFALIASFTVLPAALTLLHSERLTLREPILKPIGALISPRRRFAALGFAFGLIAFFYVLATGVQFNFSVMSIRDPNAESVVTLADLQADKVESDFIITLLVEDPDQVEPIAEKLDELLEVSEVRTPLSYVAEDQEEKLEILEDAASFLWTALEVSPQDPLTDQQRREAVEGFLQASAELQSDDVQTMAALGRLSASFQAVLFDAGADEKLQHIEANLTGSALKQLDRLRLALEADYYEFEDLPEQLRSRLVSPEGISRISIFPAEDITEVEPLQRFVDAVQPIAPNATGRPVIETGVGEIVVRSFIQAGIYAFVLITLLLYAVLRNVHDTALVLAPILLAGLLTIATSNYLGIPFNFANVIAIPLIFGLGVDSAIHLVLRAKEEHSANEVVSSSTPQAVLLSSLTTIGAFASLSLSPHLGVASMGILLTIGISWSLVCTLLVLPALLRISSEAREYLRQG
jgi:hopanoid biosynthesis associated RND transporter like protein HpnN